MTKEEAALQLTPGIVHTVTSGFVRLRTLLYTWRHLSWAILACAALNVIFIGGKRRAFGIFVASLSQSFGNQTSMTELNWIGDSYASLGFFLMPFATTMILRAHRPYRLTMLAAGVFIFISCFTSAAVPSPSYLFLTHTLLHGIGSTLVLCSTSLIAGDYFDKTHRFHVLATAFVSGGPYGVLIFGPLFSNWIHNYGWRKAFEICGVLFLFACSGGAILFLPRDTPAYSRVTLGDESGDAEESWTARGKHLEEEEEGGPASASGGGGGGGGDGDGEAKTRMEKISRIQKLIKEPKATDGKGWAFCSTDHLRQNPQIFLWGLERLVHNLVMYGLMMNLVTYVTTVMNNEIMRGSKINLYFGIGESIVFTLGALFGDRIRGHLAKAYFVGSMFAAIFLLIIQRTYTDVTVISVLSGFVGASVGVGNTFLYAAAEEIMLVHGSIAFPMTKMIAGIGMLLAPLMSGMIIDRFGFRGFFISMAVLVCVRVIILLGINIILYRKKARLEQVATELARELGSDPATAITHCCRATNQPCGAVNAFVPRSSIIAVSHQVSVPLDTACDGGEVASSSIEEVSGNVYASALARSGRRQSSTSQPSVQ